MWFLDNWNTLSATLSWKWGPPDQSATPVVLFQSSMWIWKGVSTMTGPRCPESLEYLIEFSKHLTLYHQWACQLLWWPLPLNWDWVQEETPDIPPSTVTWSACSKSSGSASSVEDMGDRIKELLKVLLPSFNNVLRPLWVAKRFPRTSWSPIESLFPQPLWIPPMPDLLLMQLQKPLSFWLPRTCQLL